MGATTGGGISAGLSPKMNLIAVVAPTATDDMTKGYTEGSVWVDNVTNTAYTCVEDAQGAAIWTNQGGASGAFSVAGAGLTSTGNTVDAVGTAGQIVVGADSIGLATTAVTPGTYNSVTVDSFGRATAGSLDTVAGGTGSFTTLSSSGATTLAAGTTIGGLSVSNASGQIPVSNGTLNTNLNADLLDGISSESFALLSGATFTGPITASTITGLSSPVNPSDAATKAYADALKAGLDIKESVRLASTANIDLTTGTLLTIDGVVTVAGDRVLVKNQTTASQNGIYIAAVGAWVRSTDADTDVEVTSGMYAYVSEGAANASNGFVLTTADPIVVGTTALTFTQFSGAGQIVAGAGLTKTANTLDVGTASASRIVVNADNIDLATVGTAGTFDNVTTDAYGRVTAGAAITAGAGLVRTANDIAVGTASVSRIVVNADDIDLALSGASAGTFNSVTVDTYGRVTAGSNVAESFGFSNIAVAAQSTIVADTATDTLTLVAGANIGITTDATTDTITLAVVGTVPSATNSTTVAGLAPGNASGQIPINNGILNVNLNADLLDGLSTGSATGQIPVNNGSLNLDLNAGQLRGLLPSNASGEIPINNGILNVNLNADLLDGLNSTAFAAALVNWTEAGSVAAPNNVRGAVVWRAVSTLTDSDAAIEPKGTGAFLLQIPDSTATGGNKRGTYAVDLQRVRSFASRVASGNSSTISGGGNNTASGTDSVVGGGTGNTATATGATTAGGQSNSNSGDQAAISGGNVNTASGTYSVIAGGFSNTASGIGATVSGGAQNTVTADYTYVPGGRGATTRGISGAAAWSGQKAFGSGALGDSQEGKYLLKVQMTGTTATRLSTDQAAASVTNQIVLPDSSSFVFTGEMVARNAANGDTSLWRIEGGIRRGAGVGTTAFVGTPTVTLIASDAGAVTWAAAVTADTTLGCLGVTVAAAAAVTVRAVANLRVTELVY